MGLVLRGRLSHKLNSTCHRMMFTSLSLRHPFRHFLLTLLSGKVLKRRVLILVQFHSWFQIYALGRILSSLVTETVGECSRALEIRYFVSIARGYACQRRHVLLLRWWLIPANHVPSILLSQLW